MEQITLKKEDLAELLGFEKSTMNRKVSDEPETLPPFINLGTAARRKPVWLVETVTQWLKAREGLNVAAGSGSSSQSNLPGQANALVPQKRRRGRPTKAEQISQQRGKGAADRRVPAKSKG